MSLTNREVYEQNMKELEELRWDRTRYEYQINELEKRIEWLKQMNEGLVKLSREILRGVNNEKQCDY